MRRRGVCLAVLAWAACLIVGCDPRPPSPRTPDGLRVVSLTPGLTRMVVDLGLGDAIVGVAEHDDVVPPRLDAPVLGNFLDVDLEKLAAAKPTHVLMMTGKEGPPANLAAMADAMGFTLVAYPYPQSVADVAAMLDDPHGQLGPPSIGEVLDLDRHAAALRRELLGGLDAIEATLAGAEVDRPRTLLVFGEGVPVMAIGPGAPLDELLTYAGGRNAAAGTGVPAPTFDREKLADLDPQVIVLLSPGGPPLGGLDRDARLAPFRGLPVPAVEHGRLYLMNHPEVLLPTTSMLATTAELATLLHPDRADAIAAAVDSVGSGP